MRVADTEEETRVERRRDDVRGWLPLVLALITLIFNAGWVYATLTTMSDKVDELPKTLELNYVRKDVYEERQRAVSTQLQEMKQLLEKLQPPTRASSSDSEFGRRFDK